MHNSAIGLNARNLTRPAGFYTERFLSSHYNSKPAANLDHHLSSRFPSLNGGTPWRNDEHLKQEKGWLGQSKQNPIEIDSLKLQKIQEKSPNLSQILSQEREKLGLKRKLAPDAAEIDLNLSLGLESRNGDEDDDDEDEEEDGDDEELGLSLYTVPEPSTKKMKGDFVNVGDEKARGASTLDLTL